MRKIDKKFLFAYFFIVKSDKCSALLADHHVGLDGAANRLRTAAIYM